MHYIKFDGRVALFLHGPCIFPDAFVVLYDYYGEYSMCVCVIDT